MDILVNVANQKLKIATNLKSLVAGTQEFIRFIFNFTGDWDNLKIFAQFCQDGIAYNQYLDDNNSVYLPAEIKAGFCTLILYGSKDSTKATTNYLTLKIDDNILIQDSQSIDISKSLYDQLVESFDTKSDQLVELFNTQSNQLIELFNAKSNQIQESCDEIKDNLYSTVNNITVYTKKSHLTLHEGKTIYYDGSIIDFSNQSVMELPITENCNLYVERPTTTGYYLAVAVYKNGEISKSNFIKRYRSEDGNLPTSDKPLSLLAGQVVAINYINSCEWIATVDTGKTQINNVEYLLKYVNDNKVKYSKLDDNIYIMQGKSTYLLKRDTKSSINLDTWRLVRQIINGVIVWDEIDIEGPLQEKDTDDFIGGYHGDEIFDTIEVYADGVLIDISGNINETLANDITVFVKSNVYHYNSSTIAFERYKKLEFTNKTLRISNLWKYIDTTDFILYNTTGAGIYSIYTNLINGYETNINPQMKNEVTTIGNEELKEVKIYGKSGFKITVTGLSKVEEGYLGTVTYFGEETNPRIKPYFMTVHNGTPKKILKQNDKLNTMFEIKVE